MDVLQFLVYQVKRGQQTLQPSAEAMPNQESLKRSPQERLKLLCKTTWLFCKRWVTSLFLSFTKMGFVL